MGVTKRARTVGELRELIAGLSDRTLVCIEGHDHSYVTALAGVERAARTEDGDLYEHNPRDVGVSVVDVLVIRG